MKSKQSIDTIKTIVTIDTIDAINTIDTVDTISFFLLSRKKVNNVIYGYILANIISSFESENDLSLKVTSNHGFKLTMDVLHKTNDSLMLRFFFGFFSIFV